MIFPWCWTFSCRSCRISPARHWNILESLSLLKIWSLSLVQWVFSVRYFLAKMAANRTHNLQLTPGHSEHVCYYASSQEKQVLSILMVRGNFSLVPWSLSFRYVWISLLVRGLLGKLYLWIYLFYSFYFFFSNLYMSSAVMCGHWKSSDIKICYFWPNGMR